MNRCPTCGAREKRSLEQNARYWSLLSVIAQSVDAIDAATGEVIGLVHQTRWHVQFKFDFLGCIDMRMASGRVITVLRSTADLDVPKFSDYMTQVEAWAAERGAYLPDREVA
jgi:hypothetical protein